MPSIKISKSYQITIPMHLREELGLEVGDLIMVNVGKAVAYSPIPKALLALRGLLTVKRILNWSPSLIT